MEIFKPGRYINREWNAVHKEWAPSMLKVALCFPDIYEIGMSHLGMKIIYGILNEERDVVCERIFAPWEDKEKEMRSKDETLLSLESGRELKDFDIIGFSLQYEMNFVDALNILDLGRVPLMASERGDNDPLVIAGGPCCFNPGPMSDFVDAFVIGEAEDTIIKIAALAKDLKGRRKEIIEEICKIDGVYAPQIEKGAINKNIVKDLDAAYFPTSPVVPYIQIVHDRIAIEIMRGCPHRCNFCQACRIFHPLRLRSVKRILEIAGRSVRNTGYEEISLLSLSTSDYPHLEELIEKLEEKFKGLGVKISLPSVRAGSFHGDKAGSVLKRAGLTFAPEAGSDRLRKKLNKNMRNEDIIQKSLLALRSGWRKVKLYFMIGLPGETGEDLDAITELASQIKSASLSISPFIPKPHSGFEREGMDELEALKEKKQYLGSKLRTLGSRRHMKVDFHNPEMSRVEAILSRGDRKIGTVIKKAWQKGARLQAWTDFFDHNIWDSSFEECGIDPKFYLNKKDEKETLSWDFIQ